MYIRTGCDIVVLARFTALIERSGELLLPKLFTPHELEQATSLHSYAGLFAAKEAVLKALDLQPGSWHQIIISKKNTGKPVVTVYGFQDGSIVSQDISISHDGDYAMATACFLLKCQQ